MLENDSNHVIQKDDKKNTRPRLSKFREKLLSTKKEELQALARHISGFHAKTIEQKVETLIQRLWALLPARTIKAFLEQPDQFRLKALCHEAAIELYRQHPYLSLAPAVTRSLLGYPTKNDRKKKRGTGPQMRSEAQKKGFKPDKNLLENLRVKLENVLLELPLRHVVPTEWTLFHIHIIQTVEMFLALTESQRLEDFIPFIMQVQPFSDHSQKSLDCLTTLFSSIGLKHPPQGSITPITSPDLVFVDAETKQPWYVELKEYHRGTRHSIHTTAQIFKYLAENPHVILVSTQQNFFVKELQAQNTRKAMLNVIQKYQRELSRFMSDLDKSKNAIFNTYRSLQEQQFSVKEEMLFICLFNDYFLHARGKIFAQLMELKEMKKLVKDLPRDAVDIVILDEPTKEMIKEAIKTLAKSPLALLVIFTEQLCEWNH